MCVVAVEKRDLATPCKLYIYRHTHRGQSRTRTPAHSHCKRHTAGASILVPPCQSLAGAGPRGRPRLRCGEPAAADLRSPEPRWRAPCPLRTYPGRPRPREPRARARTPLTRLRPASRCPDALIRVSCRAARSRRRGRACLRSYGSRRLLLDPLDALRSRPLPLTRRTGERAGAARMGDLEPDDFFVAAGGQSAGDPYCYLRRRPGARGRGGPPAALGAAGSGAARSDAPGRAGVELCAISGSPEPVMAQIHRLGFDPIRSSRLVCRDADLGEHERRSTLG